MSVHVPQEVVKRVMQITRPDPRLMWLYAIGSLAGTVVFFIPLLVLYFKYHTLLYRFDGEGVSISWGILFRRETHLTYSRIQDIHLSRNIFERWLGLGKVQIQTASGSAGAEITIEGVREFNEIRDFLYSRMRGHKEAGAPAAEAGKPTEGVTELLVEIRDDLRELRGRLSGGT